MSDQDINKRIAVPPKIRFEVFKRDKFTCQYCGEGAPQVILNCDHIDPVAAGGGNEIINLITSCKRCNGGKGATPLSDRAALDKQHALLAELEERRQQLDMMLRWRDELEDLQSDTVEAVIERIKRKEPNFDLNELGRQSIKRWIARFSLEEVLDAVDWSFRTYLSFVGDVGTQESWGKAFKKIPDTVVMLREQAERPYLSRLLYIQGIVRKRTKARRYQCLEYLEHLVLCGADVDDMERRAKRMRTFDDFEGPYDQWLTQIGRPF